MNNYAIVDTSASRVAQETNNQVELSNVSLVEEKIVEIIKSMTITAAASVSVSVIDAKLTPKISQAIIQNTGFCLGNFISQAGIKSLSILARSLIKVNHSSVRVLGSNLASTTVVPAVCEEVEFRWLLQKLILKELPEAALRHVAPEYAHLVDSQAARICRIAAASLLFAYCHVSVLDCGSGGGISQLVGGILYGTLYEYDIISLLGCANLHSLFNIFNHYL